MSRLTATQVIAKGDYLQPDFEPSTLTVSQLLGVLSYHDAPYPTPYSKPKLIQAFNDEIKAKSTKHAKARLQHENSLPSDDGIKDGLTGEFIGAKPAAPVRRSSRRLSRPPDDLEPKPEPEEAPKPKRRRSSAQPNLGGPSRPSKAPSVTQPTLAEESEPEEDELPARKVGRPKKTAAAAGEQSRRVSNNDSGWEDNNIFQSGAESSSPAKPSPVRPYRKSVASRKSRKAASVPPERSPESSPLRVNIPQDTDQLSSPESKFSPTLPRETVLMSQRLHTPIKIQERSPTPLEEEGEPVQYDFEDFEQGTGMQSVAEVNQELLGHSDPEEFEEELIPENDPTTTMKQPNPDDLIIAEPVARGPSTLTRILYLFVSVAMLASVINYKLEAAPLGYCDTGKSTNQALQSLRDRRALEKACVMENRTYLYTDERDDTLCPPPALLPIPQVDACTPCPLHASCSQDTVVCDKGYLLTAHPLLRFFHVSPQATRPIVNGTWPVANDPDTVTSWLLSVLADGLPGFGSVALPPHCQRDRGHVRHLDFVSSAVAQTLKNHRGQLVCEGETRPVYTDKEGGEARRWGLELQDLKTKAYEVQLARMRKNKLTENERTKKDFDNTFLEVINDELREGDILVGEDNNGRRFLAHRDYHLSAICLATVEMRNVWQRWRVTFFGILTLLATISYNRRQRAKKREDAKALGPLVKTTLEALRNQELAHHVDPVSTPKSSLSSIQLRDLVLQDEHSIKTRERVWRQVERVVEGNANVRTNLEEVEGGDEQRVWRWVGSSNALPSP